MAATILNDGNDLASSNGDNGLAMTAMMIMMAMMEWFGNGGKGSDLVSPYLPETWSRPKYISSIVTNLFDTCSV